MEKTDKEIQEEIKDKIAESILKIREGVEVIEELWDKIKNVDKEALENAIDLINMGLIELDQIF